MYQWFTDRNIEIAENVMGGIYSWFADSDIKATQEKIVEIMQNSSEIDVPLLVEAGSGNNGDEAH